MTTRDDNVVIRSLSQIGACGLFLISILAAVPRSFRHFRETLRQIWFVGAAAIAAATDAHGEAEIGWKTPLDVVKQLVAATFPGTWNEIDKMQFRRSLFLVSSSTSRSSTSPVSASRSFSCCAASFRAKRL